MHAKIYSTQYWYSLITILFYLGLFIPGSSSTGAEPPHSLPAALPNLGVKTMLRLSVASDGTLGNDDLYSPSISADGRFVAFHSMASNLVPGDTNDWIDVFVHDRQK
jgi:hypothetical protein